MLPPPEVQQLTPALNWVFKGFLVGLGESVRVLRHIC